MDGKLMLGVLLSVPLWAGTAIVDTLRYRFNDELANCTLYITDVTPSADSTTTYAPGTLAYSVVNGVVNLTLEPNDAATPAGTSYSVQYACQKGKALPPEVWVVPSGGPFAIRAVRAAIVPSPTVLFSPAQINFAGWPDGCLMVMGGALNSTPCGAWPPLSLANVTWTELNNTIWDQLATAGTTWQ